jgi:hypothetical protein
MWMGWLVLVMAFCCELNKFKKKRKRKAKGEKSKRKGKKKREKEETGKKDGYGEGVEERKWGKE